MVKNQRKTGKTPDLTEKILGNQPLDSCMIRFPSSPPNKNAEKDTRNCANSAFLLLFRAILSFQSLQIIVCDEKSLSFRGVCDFSGWALFVFVKIVGFIKIMAIIKILFLNGEIMKM